jgi:hypothetical protein
LAQAAKFLTSALIFPSTDIYRENTVNRTPVQCKMYIAYRLGSPVVPRIVYEWNMYGKVHTVALINISVVIEFYIIKLNSFTIDIAS